LLPVKFGNFGQAIQYIVGLEAFTTAQTTAKAVELCSNIVKGTRRNGTICICKDDRTAGRLRIHVLHPATSRLRLTAPEARHHGRNASTDCAPSVACMLIARARLSERCDRGSDLTFNNNHRDNLDAAPRARAPAAATCQDVDPLQPHNPPSSTPLLCAQSRESPTHIAAAL